MSDKREQICMLAAYHCATVAALKAAEKRGNNTADLAEEVEKAYDALVVALAAAGYVTPYLAAAKTSKESKH